MTTLLCFSFTQTSFSQSKHQNESSFQERSTPLLSPDDMIKDVQRKKAKELMELNPLAGNPFKDQFKAESKRLKRKFWADVTPILIISFIVFICILLFGKKKKQPTEPINQSNNTSTNTLITSLENKRVEKLIQDGLATTVIKVRCRSCNHLNEEGNSFCSDCGKKV